MNQIENIMALADEAAEAKAETIRLEYETWHRRFKRDALHKNADDTKQALRAAIEQALAVQPEQEPVAWTWDTKSQHDGFLDAHFQFSKPDEHPNILNLQALYTAPQPQREWVGLTDEEIEDCWDGYLSDCQLQQIREISVKLREKNS